MNYPKLPNIEKSIDQIKKIIVFSIILVTLSKIVFYYLNIEGIFVQITNSLDLIVLLFTIFLIIFTISQFIYSIASSELSSYVMLDFNNDPRIIRFFIFESMMIIFYLIIDTTFINNMIANFTFVPLLITMYLLIDIIDLQFIFTNPKLYIKKIEGDIINKNEDEKIVILSDICKKYLSKKEISIVKMSIDSFKSSLIKYDKNDEISRKKLIKIINELYDILDCALKSNSEEIASKITYILYELYYKDMKLDKLSNNYKFNDTSFITEFIINDKYGNIKEQNKQNKTFSSFYNKTLEYDSESLDNLNFILLNNISIIYDEKNKNNEKINYLGYFIKKCIDKDKFEEYKNILNKIPRLQIDTYNSNEEITNKRLNLDKINLNYITVGGYLLYKFDEKKVIKYINELYNHNITKYRVNYLNYVPNIFYKTFKKLIGLYLKNDSYIFDFDNNIDLENKYYTNQFFSYVLMNTEKIDNIQIDKEVLERFVYYKEEIINSCEENTYKQLVNSNIFSNEYNIKKIFNIIEMKIQEEIKEYKFTDEELEKISIKFKEKFENNLKNFDKKHIVYEEKKFANEVIHEYPYTKESFIKFNENPKYICEHVLIRYDDTIRLIIYDYIIDKPEIFETNEKKKISDTIEKEICISNINSRGIEEIYGISNINLKYKCDVECFERKGSMIVKLIINYEINDSLKITNLYF